MKRVFLILIKGGVFLSKHIWKSSDQVLEYLEEYSSTAKNQINNEKLKNNLLKSYVFETFDKELQINNKTVNLSTEIKDLFENKSTKIKQIDEIFYEIIMNDRAVGFIEQLNDRFCTLYTTEASKKSDQWTQLILKESTILDSLWISGIMFDEFLKELTEYHNPLRYTKMKFEFNAMFQQSLLTEDIDLKNEHKISSVTLVEELSGITEKLSGAREYFPSFYSVGSLRFPSNVGKGGHDVYQNGKFTNRSDSFSDHRQQLKQVVNSYELITKKIESQTWLEVETVQGKNNFISSNFKASPVTIKFKKPLQVSAFNNFVETTFPKGRGPFKIFGEIKRISLERVHIYGIDLHLWQNVFLDLSSEQFILFLPKGTCGNTIHRLITNIQKFLEPELLVYIGNNLYSEIIADEIGGN